MMGPRHFSNSNPKTQKPHAVMKPKIHLTPRPKQLRDKQQISFPATFGSFATLCLVGLMAPSAGAAVVSTTYTIIPGESSLDWNTSSNWTPTLVEGVVTGVLFPGAAAPLAEDSTSDTARVTGAFGGMAQTVNISEALAFPLAALVLGDTTGNGLTTVQASNGVSLGLNAASIISQGPLTPSNVTNLISAPLVLTGNLTIAAATEADTSTNDLTVSGKITPSAATARSIINNSGKTVSFGNIDISTGSTAATLTLRNATAATSRINLHGVIDNGSTVAAGLLLDAGVNSTVFEIGNNSINNTYTGTTSLNGNGARTTKFLINSPQPFGPASAGRLTLAGGSGANTILEAINGNRTIPNLLVTMQRTTSFEGSNNLTFAGTVTTGSSHVVTNNMTGSARLVFNGRYDLDNSNQTTSPSDSRSRPFGGTGTTLFNGILADHAIPSADMFGGVEVTGAGTIIVTGTATYQGNTRITGSGTVQLGDGGTTGTISPDFPNLSYDDANTVNGTQVINNPLLYPNFVKKPVVTGGTTGTGTFAVKRSDDLALEQTLNGGIGLKHIGSGVLTVSSAQFNSGANTIGDGVSPSKLVVTAAALEEATQTGDFGTPQVHGSGYNTYYQIVENLEDTSLLRVGQPAYITTPSAALYIHSIDSATQVTVMGTGIGIGTNATTGGPATGLIPGMNITGPVVNQPIKFGAGSSLGTSAATTTVKALSTLEGTGAISGAVIVEGNLHPGSGIGTLTTGPLTFQSGSTLAIEINTTDLSADKVVVTGDVAANGTVNLTLTDLGADVALPEGTKLILVDYSGTWAAENLLSYGGNPVANNSNITLGANSYIVNYSDPAVDGTALTLTVGTAVANPYETWINGFSAQLTEPADRLPGADPDQDGRSNLLEFALNGNPASASDSGKMVISTEDSGDVGTDRDLSVTLAVRNGAVLGTGAGGSATLTIDGMVYTIQGSQNLLTWDSAINEVTPASVLVPAPDAGWTARTFQVTDSNGLPDKRFIRVGVE
jgi:hypothetical protein